MELGEKRIDLLSILSMIELEAASGDEMEAYLFQEGDGSTIFQAGGKEHRSWKSEFETSGAASLQSADPEAHPIQAIEVSLRRWIDFLENHDVIASYKDLLQLHSFAKRFMNLVEFFFLTLVDILLKSSQIFDALLVSTETRVLFPQLSSFIEQSDAAGDDGTEERSPGSTTPAAADHRSRSNKSELQRLQEWLMDGIDYLGNQEIMAYYEDYQFLHDAAKQLLELVESYLKNLADRLLKQFAALVGDFVHEPVCLKASQ